MLRAIQAEVEVTMNHFISKWMIQRRDCILIVMLKTAFIKAAFALTVRLHVITQWSHVWSYEVSKLNAMKN